MTIQPFAITGAPPRDAAVEGPPIETETGGVMPGEAATNAASRVRGRWTFRMMLTALGVGLLGFGLGVMPMLWWHYQQNRAGERREALALAGWLAASTTHALEADEEPAPAADGLLQVPGVSEVLVLSRDGTVLAPASRAGEVIDRLPGLNLAPSAISRAYDTHVGPQVQVARPARAKGDPHAAIVWLAFDPAVVNDGPALVLGPALIAACGLSLLAGWLAARRAQGAMSRLNDGLQAMLAGRLDALADPLGALPIRDLTVTLTHLVTRLRATASGDLRRMRAAAGGSGDALVMPGTGTVAVSTYAVAPAPAPARAGAGAGTGTGAGTGAGPARVTPQLAMDGVPDDEPGLDVRAEDAYLVTNAELRIVRASPTGERLLGEPAGQLLGRHLLEIVPSAALADAILSGLAGLPSAGEAETRASLDDGAALSVVIHRAAPQAGVTVVFRPAASAPDTARPEGDVS